MLSNRIPPRAAADCHQSPRIRLVVGLLLASWAICLGTVGPACAQELKFRVDSAIYRDGKKEPIAETKTLFHDGLVYDFMLTGTREITILDVTRQRILLLDPVHQRWSHIHLEDILQVTAGTRDLIEQDDDRKRKDLLLPTFRESYDEDTRTLTLSSKYLTYETVCAVPKFRSAPLLYRQFADWSSRLNSMRPGNVPPFGRLDLNAAIETRGLIPKSVTRTVLSSRYLSREKSVTRSDHLVVWGLSKTDHDEIARVTQFPTTFQQVTFDEYRGAENPEEKKSSNR